MSLPLFSMGSNPNFQSIPFQRSGNLILIQAKIDGRSGNFILDTGAPYLVLNSTYFSNKDLATETASSLAGEFGISHSIAHKLSIGETVWTDLEAYLAPLGAVENAKGVRIHGLLGRALFVGYELIIDYRKNQIDLIRLNNRGGRIENRDQSNEVFSCALKESPDALMCKVKIGNSKLRAVVDTGAEISVLDKDVPADVAKELNIDRRFYLNGVGGNRVEVVSGRLSSLELNGLEIRNTQFVMSSLEAMNKVYSKRIDAILGFPIFSAYLLSINFVTSEMTFYQHD
ncbi:MAG TPA: hypothetical protein DCS15_08565 [Flavobacteriales bacterium]|nr:hypothetical protein [Flavobacteriales bacterium]